jgi:hypothetical protein
MALPSGGSYIALAAVNSRDIRSSVWSAAPSPNAASALGPPARSESSTNDAAFWVTATSVSSAGTEPARDRAATSVRRDWMSPAAEPIKRRSLSPTSHIVPSGKTEANVWTIDRRSASDIS